MSNGPSFQKQPFHDPGRPSFTQPTGRPGSDGAGPVLLVLSAVVVLAMIVGGAVFAIGALDRDESTPTADVGRTAESFGTDPVDAAGAASDDDREAPVQDAAKSGRTSRGGVQVLEGGDETRGLKVTLPDPVVDSVKFPVMLDGSTGKGLSGIGSGGGFIVKAHLMRGGRACPDGKVVHDGIMTTNDELASMNVFVAGRFRWAQNGYAGDPGRQRVCGYISRPDLNDGYDLVIDEPVEVEENTGRTSFDDPSIPTGTYVAKAADIEGGTKGSAITITLVPGSDEPRVGRVQVEGLTLSTCPTTEDHPLRGTAIDADLSIPGYEGADNAFIGDTVSAL
ncbi:MAG: hypothetical protein Q7T55_15820, partial [Solirubrobacteraceae bacterium]|nr:hypothetical protein [Solirubrobacteraceae bacterium]